MNMKKKFDPAPLTSRLYELGSFASHGLGSAVGETKESKLLNRRGAGVDITRGALPRVNAVSLRPPVKDNRSLDKSYTSHGWGGRMSGGTDYLTRFNSLPTGSPGESHMEAGSYNVKILSDRTDGDDTPPPNALGGVGGSLKESMR